jgi:hypothetical protein
VDILRFPFDLTPNSNDVAERVSVPSNLPLGHPAKNDCSSEVLLDFCTRVTFLRSVPDNFFMANARDLEPGGRTHFLHLLDNKLSRLS